MTMTTTTIKEECYPRRELRHRLSAMNLLLAYFLNQVELGLNELTHRPPHYSLVVSELSISVTFTNSIRKLNP